MFFETFPGVFFQQPRADSTNSNLPRESLANLERHKSQQEQPTQHTEKINGSDVTAINVAPSDTDSTEEPTPEDPTTEDTQDHPTTDLVTPLQRDAARTTDAGNTAMSCGPDEPLLEHSHCSRRPPVMEGKKKRGQGARDSRGRLRDSRAVTPPRNSCLDGMDLS